MLKITSNLFHLYYMVIQSISTYLYMKIYGQKFISNMVNTRLFPVCIAYGIPIILSLIINEFLSIDFDDPYNLSQIFILISLPLYFANGFILLLLIHNSKNH